MKAAIIGLGPMGRRLLSSLQQVEGVHVAAVCDQRPEALADAGLPSGVACFTDAEVLFREIRPDLAVIATTAPSHPSLIALALASCAKAIHCEKPIACSLVSAQQMMTACREQGVSLAVNHCRRHVPAYQWLREKIQAGSWGELRGIRSSAPGIGLGCLGTHFVDLMRFLSGENFIAVTGWVDAEKGANPRGKGFHDPGGMLIAQGSAGTYFVHHQIEDGSGPASLAIDLTSARILVEEREGTVQVLARDRSQATGPGKPPKYDLVEVPREMPLTLDIVALSAASLREQVSGVPPTCSAEHGCRSLEAVLAAYLSHEGNHAPVVLPLTHPHQIGRELPIT